MMFDSNSLLTAEELTIPRTPMELACWVEDKCHLFSDYPEAKEWVLLRQGLSKKFHEEIYPLKLFVMHFYTGRSDIQCIPNLDNRNFDARILDYSTSPPSELKVEITSAIEGHNQSIRMEYLVKHGHVSTWGTLSHSGTKKSGHEIHIKNEMIAHTDHLEHTFSLIQKAVKEKSMRPNKPQKYGQGHVLIVTFDDWQWFKPEYIAALKDFVNKHVLTLPIDFAALYVLGLSGKTFVHFEPLKIQDSLTVH